MSAANAEPSHGAVMVFARAPEPGRCKTRLIPALGADGAAALQGVLVEHAVATALEAAVGQVELWCAPDADHGFFRRLATATGVVLRGQCDGDLGARMASAFSATLSLRPWALLTGADAPALTVGDLRHARDALVEGLDAVCVPAEDGGYVLIGLRRFAPSLFAEIAWGSGRVMALTRERLDGLGWRTRLLPQRWDVDRPADLQRLAKARLLDADAILGAARGASRPFAGLRPTAVRLNSVHRHVVEGGS